MNFDKKISAVAASLVSFISFSAAQQPFSSATGDPLGFITGYFNSTLNAVQQQPEQWFGNVAAFAFIWLFNYMLIYIPVRVARERLDENDRTGSDALIDFMNALTGHDHSRGIRGEKEKGHRNYLLILTFLGTASMYGAGLGPTIQSVQTWFVFFDNLWLVLIGMAAILATLAGVIIFLFGYNGLPGFLKFFASRIPFLDMAAQGVETAGREIRNEAGRRGRNALDDLLMADNEIDEAWNLYREFKRKRGQEDFDENQTAREIAGLLKTGVEDLLSAEEELKRVLDDDLERVEKDISELKNDLKLDKEEVSELETLEEDIGKIAQEYKDIVKNHGFGELQSELQASGSLYYEWNRAKTQADNLEDKVEHEASVKSALEDLRKDIKALKLFKKLEEDHGEKLKRAKKMEMNLPNYLEDPVKSEVQSKIDDTDRKAREVWQVIEDESDRFEQLIREAETLVSKKIEIDEDLVDQMSEVMEKVQGMIEYLGPRGGSGTDVETKAQKILSDFEGAVSIKRNEIKMMESLLEDA